MKNEAPTPTPAPTPNVHSHPRADAECSLDGHEDVETERHRQRKQREGGSVNSRSHGPANYGLLPKTEFFNGILVFAHTAGTTARTALGHERRGLLWPIAMA